jgi:hypothetical protein
MKETLESMYGLIKWFWATINFKNGITLLRMTTATKSLLWASIFSFLYNLVSFAILSLVSPLDHALGNVMKRIATIVLSMIVFKNKWTPFNVCGMALANIGVILYGASAKQIKSNEDSVACRHLPTSTYINNPHKTRKLKKYAITFVSLIALFFTNWAQQLQRASEKYNLITSVTDNEFRKVFLTSSLVQLNPAAAHSQCLLGLQRLFISILSNTIKGSIGTKLEMPEVMLVYPGMVPSVHSLVSIEALRKSLAFMNITTVSTCNGIWCDRATQAWAKRDLPHNKLVILVQDYLQKSHSTFSDELLRMDIAVLLISSVLAYVPDTMQWTDKMAITIPSKYIRDNQTGVVFLPDPVYMADGHLKCAGEPAFDVLLILSYDVNKESDQESWNLLENLKINGVTFDVALWNDIEHNINGSKSQHVVKSLSETLCKARLVISDVPTLPAIASILGKPMIAVHPFPNSESNLERNFLRQAGCDGDETIRTLEVSSVSEAIQIVHMIGSKTHLSDDG